MSSTAVRQAALPSPAPAALDATPPAPALGDSLERLPLRAPVAFCRTPWHHRLQEGRFQPARPEARAYNGVPLAMHFDDIANALSISAIAHGKQPIGGPALIHTFLALGWILSWSMGTVPAVKNVLEARHLFRRLRHDRAFLEAACVRLGHALQPGDDVILRRQLATAEALLARNATDRRCGAARTAFTGVAAAIGTFLTGGAAGMELLTDAWKGAEEVAEWGLRVGAPFMGAFALGATGEQAHRMVRAARAGAAVGRAAMAQSWGEDRVNVPALLNHRRQEMFWQSAAYSASLLGMGVGIQLIAFWGPQGVWPLIPGVVGMCLTSYTEHENISYRRPLAIDEALRLDSTAALASCLTFTQLDYRLLKGLKHGKRAEYPWAGQSPWILGAWPRGVQWAARAARNAWSRGVRPPLPSAQHTVLGYLAARRSLEQSLLAQSVALLREDLREAAQAEAAVETRLQAAQAQLDRVQASLPGLGTAASEGDALPPAQALPLLFDFLQEQGLDVAFGNKIMNGARMAHGKRLSERLQIGLEVDLDAIAAQLTADTLANRQCAQALFGVGEDVLLNTFKAWQHSRARELCDLLLERPAVESEAPLAEVIIEEA